MLHLQNVYNESSVMSVLLLKAWHIYYPQCNLAMSEISEGKLSDYIQLPLDPQKPSVLVFNHIIISTHYCIFELCSKCLIITFLPFNMSNGWRYHLSAHFHVSNWPNLSEPCPGLFLMRLSISAPGTKCSSGVMILLMAPLIHFDGFGNETWTSTAWHVELLPRHHF